ncbi:IS66 family insertion sequence element accessory protein TnpB [Novosphingobium sp. AP12]|uniref:IS66 family insertion sequence element accessory protein TnpB n=1 Tax=Novosphingobium sp. AP12 TaxID=1144305 RepID=UPI000271F5A6|nr:IS66 family insertion sequence element accessory protein TnpB [Novosphingobium sp. AP12]EJL35173.1 transposase [Novosphingobium sp. AP12]
MHWGIAMFRLAEDLRVYLHRDPIDFRCGINSLAILVEQSMGLNPFERAAFAFCNRRRTRMKLLFFDRSGFVLVLKALTEDKIRWPKRAETVVALTAKQLRWLLDGIDIDAMVPHPVRQYQFVG